MTSKTYKRKNANSKNKNNNKNKKSIKRNSIRKYRTKKMRSNIRKMKGGGLKEVVLSYFKEKKIDIQNYSQNLNITDTKIDRIEFNNQIINLTTMGALAQDLDLYATVDNPPTNDTKWVHIDGWSDH